MDGTRTKEQHNLGPLKKQEHRRTSARTSLQWSSQGVVQKKSRWQPPQCRCEANLGMTDVKRVFSPSVTLSFNSDYNVALIYAFVLRDMQGVQTGQS